MRALSWWLTLALTLAPVGGAFVSAATGCDDGGDAGSTTGKRVTFATTIGADSPGTAFTRDDGWTVTLTEASVAIGSLYYYDGSPPISRAPSPAPDWRWTSLWQPSVAHAHPGHYVAGNALGEMLSPWSADLFAGTTALPLGDGVTGLYRSGRFDFAAPSAGPAASGLAGSVAHAAGTATKDATTVHFTVSADMTALGKQVAEGKVEGCVFEEVNVAGNGTVSVTVKPSVWFELVDFASVAPGTASAPTVIAPGDPAHLGFVIGVTQLSAYRFRFTPS